MWAFLSRNRDAGLLFLRIALCGFFIWVHGWSKLAGGIEKWREVGAAMKHFGIDFGLTYWGFLAMVAETLGMVLVMIGCAFRPACLLIVLTMAVAGFAEFHTTKSFSAGLREASHAWELGIVFLALIFIGPGKYSVDKN
jgi:putative oxidoreductase